MLKIPKSQKLKFKGVRQYVYKNRKQGYTLAQIKEQAEKISKKLKKKGENYGLEVALRYPHYWYANYITKAGRQVDVTSHQDEYDEEDPNKFPEFVIYTIRDAFTRGGDSVHNDCLFDCLAQVMQDKNPFASPASLKSYLNLNRDDKIDISLMPKIEQRTKLYKLNVSGDHSYISTKEAKQIINLKLIKGHYDVDKQNNNKIIIQISDKERIPLMHMRKNDTDIVYMARNNKEIEIDSDIYWNIKDLRTEYILIPTDKYNTDKSLKQLHKEFVKDADILKKETKGRINLYKTGTNKDTAINLFNELYDCITPEPIKQHEAEWYLKCNTGAIIWCSKYQGKAYKYDYVSMYPSIMKSTMCFPIKKGEFKKLESLPDILTYGIYRCKIDNTKPKMFRTNFNDYYSHIDIYRARDLKMKITLIKDDQPNALLYSRDKLVTGSQMFGKFVNYLFPLKQKHICERVKSILNILWGALCERNLKNLKVGVVKSKRKQTIELKGNEKAMFYKPYNDNETIIKYQDNDQAFKTSFARIKPFIISKGRSMISKVIEPFIDDVCLTHTDGLVCKHSHNLKTGKEIGNLKYEGCCEEANIFSPSQKKIKGVNEFIVETKQ